MIEKRKYPRFELIVDANYKVVPSEKISGLGKTRNISAEGICFESDKLLEIGTEVSLEVNLHDTMSPVVLVGQIMWYREVRESGLKEKKYLNGVRLIDVSETDESRFLKYYCDIMVDKLANYLKMWNVQGRRP